MVIILSRRQIRVALPCIEWEQNKVLVQSLKTRHIGKHARLVPIFDTVKPSLEQMFDGAAEGETYVFPNLRSNKNPGMTAKKYVIKSKHKA